MMTDILIIFFMISGTFFMVTGTVGLLRLPDIYTRMHAITKSVTLGLAGLLLSSILALKFPDVLVKSVLAILFLFISNPVGAHMIARATYHHLKAPFWKNTFAEEWKEAVDDWNN